MNIRATAALALCLLTASTARPQGDAPDTREEEARKELLRLQGTWRLESLEGPKELTREEVKERTLFVGGEVFLVRAGEKIIQAGTLRLSPSKDPRRVDAVVRQGEHEGTTMLGVYELKGDTLRLCFDPEGDRRPQEFKTRPGSPLFVAVYRQSRPAGEGVDITGRYRCESFGAEGEKQITTAEVQRRGDAYLVRWVRAGGLAYVGIGLRKGDALSVAWANRGTVGVSVYTIEKGPRLVGVYTELTGVGLVAREQLTPVGAKRHEAAAPAPQLRPTGP